MFLFIFFYTIFLAIGAIMKNGSLYLFNNVNGLEILVGVLNIREVFINKSFIKQGYVLIGLSHDLKYRKEASWTDMEPFIDNENIFSVESFAKDYSKEIAVIYKFKEQKKLLLSWLEIFQIAAILKNEVEKSHDVIGQIIMELKSFNDFAKKTY